MNSKQSKAARLARACVLVALCVAAGVAMSACVDIPSEDDTLRSGPYPWIGSDSILVKPSEVETAEKYCAKFQECLPDEFEEEYGTGNICVGASLDYLDDCNRPQACRNAVLDFAKCQAEADCGENWFTELVPPEPGTCAYEDLFGSAIPCESDTDCFDATGVRAFSCEENECQLACSSTQVCNAFFEDFFEYLEGDAANNPNVQCKGAKQTRVKSGSPCGEQLKNFNALCAEGVTRGTYQRVKDYCDGFYEFCDELQKANDGAGAIYKNKADCISQELFALFNEEDRDPCFPLRFDTLDCYGGAFEEFKEADDKAGANALCQRILSASRSILVDSSGGDTEPTYCIEDSDCPDDQYCDFFVGECYADGLGGQFCDPDDQSGEFGCPDGQYCDEFSFTCFVGDAPQDGGGDDNLFEQATCQLQSDNYNECTAFYAFYPEFIPPEYPEPEPASCSTSDDCVVKAQEECWTYDEEEGEFARDDFEDLIPCAGDSCRCRVDPNFCTPEGIQDNGGGGDGGGGFDFCRDFGYYGDGFCDPDCPNPDPDCGGGGGDNSGGTDFCEVDGLYGDGFCDDFCPKTDPDCAGFEECSTNADCFDGETCVGGFCEFDDGSGGGGSCSDDQIDCGDGTCADSFEECDGGGGEDCDLNGQITCDDGSCADTEDECGGGGGDDCEANGQVTCDDGSCADTAEECDGGGGGGDTEVCDDFEDNDGDGDTDCDDSDCVDDFACQE